jgi:plasmid maintenance system antidote protein VapI
MIRKTTNVVLNCEEEFGPEWNWMPKRLVDLIPWVQKYLELVPEEYRASAAFKIVSFRDSRRDYWLNVKVHYDRPETDEEMEARLAAEEAQKLEQQRAERQMLEDLKEKYSDR